MSDMEGRITFVSDKTLAQYGYECKDELLGKSAFEFIEPKERKRANKNLEITLKDGFTKNIQYTMIRKDGSTFTGELSAALIRDAQGNPHAFIAITRDISDRKAAEDALRESESVLRSFYDSSPFMMGVVEIHEKDIIQISRNSTAQRFFGLPFDDIFDKPAGTRSISRKNTDLWITNYKKSKQEAAPVTFEYYDEQTEEGRWLSATVYYAGKFGRNDRYSYIVEDITERKQAETALIESEAKHRLLVENTPDIIMRFDKDARHIYVSPSISEVVDMKPEDFLGKSHRELGFPERLSEYWERKISEVFNTGEKYFGQFEFEGKEGAVIFDWRVIPEFAGDGTVRSVYSYTRDISELIKAEKMIQDSLQISDDIVRSIPSGLFIYQFEEPDRLVLVSVNPEAERLTGIKIEEWEGREFNTIWPEARKTGITDAYLNVITSGKMYEKEDQYYKDEKLEGAYKIHAFKMPGNKLAVAFNDITDSHLAAEERKRLEEQLFQAQKMESIGRLAGGIAHDFNNILTGIMGYAELLKLQLQDESTTEGEAAEVILKGTERAAALTKQLLGFARRGKYNPVPLDVNEVITDAAKVSEKIFEKNIEVKFDPDKKIKAIEADKNQMEQILTNLFINAKDAMPKGGELSIKTENVVLNEEYVRLLPEMTPGDYVKISVTDTGIGIPGEIKDNIFEPFFTTKGEGKGTGLGLATVYGIVKNHNGHINVYSEPGRGTIFNLYFPVSGKRLKRREEKRDLTKGDATILVVDDEKQIRWMSKKMLGELGYKTLLAEDGNDALKIFKKQKDVIDLVILDMIMPNMAGKDTNLELHKIKPDVKVILASGYSQNGLATEILDEGAIGFIQKPFRMNELSRIIRKALKK
ncbi:PAS domain S-box protein, partial [candidate division KSB1 bacterium]